MCSRSQPFIFPACGFFWQSFLILEVLQHFHNFNFKCVLILEKYLNKLLTLVPRFLDYIVYPI
jgi:hypothetical protein